MIYRSFYDRFMVCCTDKHHRRACQTSSSSVYSIERFPSRIVGVDAVEVGRRIRSRIIGQIFACRQATRRTRRDFAATRTLFYRPRLPRKCATYFLLFRLFFFFFVLFYLFLPLDYSIIQHRISTGKSSPRKICICSAIHIGSYYSRYLRVYLFNWLPYDDAQRDSRDVVFRRIVVASPEYLGER